jgi:hypothetical protein
MADIPREEQVKLSDAAKFLLEECRMVLPGIQAIFGFQLVAVFNQRFTDLAEAEQALHFVAMTLDAIAVAMVMCPAAYQRISLPFRVTQQFIRNSSRLLMASMVPLGIGLSLDFYLIGHLVFREAPRGWLAAAAVALFAVLCLFWFVFPRSRRLQDLLDRHADGGRDHSVL